MTEALLFGAVASSALVIGALVGARWSPPQWITAIALAFASGTLIAAAAVELFADAFETGGVVRAGVGLLAGAAVFILLDAWLERRADAARGDARGPALLAAVTLDGVPENLALGVSLVHSNGLVLLVAIFASNLPEALVGAAAMRDARMPPVRTVMVWAGAAVLLAAAVVVGRVALGGVGEEHLAAPLAFAGGAVLASLADTLMPAAYREGGPYVAFATVAGFFVAFVLANA